ncbi:MAG: hypothetical protein Q7S66_05995 [bacterium]|nr:hypothetical protein [bacterium]
MDNISSDGGHNPFQVFFSKTSTRWLIVFLAFFGAVVAIFLLNDSFSNDFKAYWTFPSEKAKSTVVRVTIDFGGGKKRAFEGSVTVALPAGEALRAAADTANIALKTTLVGDVVGVGEVGNQAGKRWHWYLNGNAENRSIFDVPVYGGDKILVRYE